MTNKELIGIARRSYDGRYMSFYEFSVNFLSNPDNSGDNGTDDFFRIIKSFYNNSDANIIQSALGKRGKDSGAVKDWCKKMLRNKELRSLNVNELHYVMGCCARMAKIKEAGMEVGI